LEGLDVSYRKHYELYCRIYDRCGLKYLVVEADSGMMGGRQSHEFMVVTDAGEDQIAHCELRVCCKSRESYFQIGSNR
jgi:prolyl-tRNA synthetase